MVSRLKHENVVHLLGYNVDGGLRVLAYEYAPKGSLHDILHGELSLNHCIVSLFLVCTSIVLDNRVLIALKSCFFIKHS